VDCRPVGLDFLAAAPVRVITEVALDTSPQRLFDVFLDADSWPRWAFAITRVTWTSPFPIAAGATRTVEMRAGMVGWETFLQWEPPTEMAFRFDRATKGGPEAFAEHYEVAPLPGGRCHLRWTMAADIPTTPAPMLPVVRGGMRAANQLMLARLRRYVAGGIDHVPRHIAPGGAP